MIEPTFPFSILPPIADAAMWVVDNIRMIFLVAALLDLFIVAPILLWTGIRIKKGYQDAGM